MSEGGRFAFTVFTPTFDRAEYLPGVRASLEAQTFRDFEWLIVDDGSNDGTMALVARWMESSSIPIRYVYQDHAGKHVAYNRAVTEAKGYMFVTIDSDDACVPNALARLWYHWHTLPEPDRDAFKGVTVLCKDEIGNLIGEPFPHDRFDTDSLELYFGSLAKGDKWGCTRTEVLRDFPFPEPAGLRFVPESVLWFAIARRYRIRCVNEMLHVARQGTSRPRLSQLTRTTAQGRLMFHGEVLTKYVDYFPRSPIVVIRCGINYSRYSFHCGRSPAQQLSAVGSGSGRLIVLACVLPGAIAYLRDVVRSRLSPRSPRSR